MRAGLRLIRQLIGSLQRISALEEKCARLQEALGRLEARQVQALQPASPQDAEYRVFSQWGEDGILDWLVSRVPIARERFVEFGVEDYTEANTRFLLGNRNWSGLIFDGDPANIAAIRARSLYWQHDLAAEAAFITRENINGLLKMHGMQGDIGLLSIDIDGNDYWVWQAIEAVSPRIVVVEYNSRLGAARAVTVPYREDFDRRRMHHSMIYYGASLRALWKLGREKGYQLVCCNRNGNNAFFVRADVLPAGLRPASVEEAFVRAKFREARDALGNLSFMDAESEERLLATLEWVEV
jgi:hypothetical protein